VSPASSNTQPRVDLERDLGEFDPGSLRPRLDALHYISKDPSRNGVKIA
jgi:hypothetical protein